MALGYLALEHIRTIPSHLTGLSRLVSRRGSQVDVGTSSKNRNTPTGP